VVGRLGNISYHPNYKVRLYKGAQHKIENQLQITSSKTSKGEGYFSFHTIFNLLVDIKYLYALYKNIFPIEITSIQFAQGKNFVR